MSVTLRDFLREEAQKHQAEIIAGKATVEEWREAVQRLFEQIRGWIKEADPEGLIRIEERKRSLTEPGLGRYDVPRLDLYFFEQWIGIIPQARKTVGTATPPHRLTPERAAGRVDLTDDLRRYILYRFKEGDSDLWMIDDLVTGAKPLDKELFEKALLSYLK